MTTPERATPPEPGDLYFDDRNQRAVAVVRRVLLLPEGWLVHAQPMEGSVFETTLAPHYWRRVDPRIDLH